MEISTNGINLIKQFEGFRGTAYLDAVGVPTIGYGHTNGVKLGDTVTVSKATEYLKEDLANAERNVNKYIDVYNFNQNQYDALVSFAFNIGNIDTLTSNGKRRISTISNKILEYCKASGKKLDGLVERRKKEKKLFDTPVTNTETETESFTTFEIAQKVIKGEYGNGSARRLKLIHDGYDYDTIQNAVNIILSKKTVLETAKYVLAGLYGDGETRKRNLQAAGYDYVAVQKVVNELVKG